MLTITLLFILAATLITIWHLATGKPSLGVAVLLLCIVHLLAVLPIGKG